MRARLLLGNNEVDDRLSVCQYKFGSSRILSKY
jgi:hypothetical protein